MSHESRHYCGEADSLAGLGILQKVGEHQKPESRVLEAACQGLVEG